jgi:hypothetical protein
MFKDPVNEAKIRTVGRKRTRQEQPSRLVENGQYDFVQV